MTYGGTVRSGFVGTLVVGSPWLVGWYVGSPWLVGWYIGPAWGCVGCAFHEFVSVPTVAIVSKF
jgi:hypothetical protein